MNRGSTERSARHVSPLWCFNEAPIHESGKSCTHSALGRSPPSFNEAPIHESGKSALLAAAIPDA